MNGSATGSGHFARRVTPWLLLLAFGAEFILFDRFGSHRFTGVYPRWNDQIQYLSEAYTGYEYARAHGFMAGLWQTLVNPSAQGTLHDCGALLVFAVAGPSRSAALALNMLALIAWQAMVFVAAVVRTGSRPLAFAAAMLPLLLAGAWADIPGSAYDFRLDHLALCALGVTCAAAWLADGFRHRAGSVVFGLAVALTLLTRFLTGTYFILIFLAFLGWTLGGQRGGRLRRTANLALAAAIAFVLAAPVFWLNREWVWNYYYIGHYVGPESAIRDPHLGLSGSIRFVATQFTGRHLGPIFEIITVISAAAAALAACFRRAPTDRLTGPAPWWPGAVFLLAPAIVLTLHRQKSEVVVGALAPGLVLLVVACWQFVAQRVKATALVGRVAAAVVAITAFAFFAPAQLRPAFGPEAIEDFHRVNAFADYVFNHARSAHLDHARVAVDCITDALDAQVLRVICYERHHTWESFEMTLPISIAEPTEAEVMARLAESDFVFLSATDGAGPYPYDRKLAQLRPQLRAWCEAHLRLTKQFTLSGRPALVYQRREIP